MLVDFTLRSNTSQDQILRKRFTSEETWWDSYKLREQHADPDWLLDGSLTWRQLYLSYCYSNTFNTEVNTIRSFYTLYVIFQEEKRLWLWLWLQ